MPASSQTQHLICLMFWLYTEEALKVNSHKDMQKQAGVTLETQAW